MDDIPAPIPARPHRFVDKVRADMRARGYAYPTERTYRHWIKRYIRFSGRRHPKDMGKADIEAFRNHLAVEATVSPSTQRTALNALMFLYIKQYAREPESLSFNYAKPIRRLPTVLTHQEAKDRTTVLPASVEDRLHAQIDKVLAQHRQDLSDGYGEVYMSHALERKYPSAARSPAWQYLFPSARIGPDPGSGVIRRHHMHNTSLRKHIKTAVAKTEIHKPVKTHTFRHSFATQLLQKGYDIRTIQTLLGHEDVTTTEIYTHVLNRGAMGVISPVDD